MNPFYSLIIALPAFALAHALSSAGAPRKPREYDNLDGLRGLAALAVFLSHSALFYFYELNGVWSFPIASFASSFYNNCGAGAVTIFFMMSAFLFYGKIRQQNDVDWGTLFTSRMLRLGPMYMISCITGVALVFLLRRNDHITIQSVVNMLAFMGVGNVFGRHHVPLMTNGTAWTLPYEWSLYLSLPFWWVVMHRRGGLPSIVSGCIFGLLTITYLHWAHLVSSMFLLFLGGVGAYELTQSAISPLLRRLARTKAASFFVVLAFLYVVEATYNQSRSPLDPNSGITGGVSICAYAVMFSLMALGNDLFGILTSHSARKLGEISYSFYILQFLILWACFGILFKGIYLSPFMHSIVAAIAGGILIFVSNIAFKKVEAPVMGTVRQVSRFVSGIFVRRVMNSE